MIILDNYAEERGYKSTAGLGRVEGIKAARRRRM